MASRDPGTGLSGAVLVVIVAALLVALALIVRAIEQGRSRRRRSITVPSNARNSASAGCVVRPDVSTPINLAPPAVGTAYVEPVEAAHDAWGRGRGEAMTQGTVDQLGELEAALVGSFSGPGLPR